MKLILINFFRERFNVMSCLMSDSKSKWSRQFAAMSFLSAILIVALHTLCAARSNAFVKCLFCVIQGSLCQAAIPWFFFASGFLLGGHIGELGWWRDAVLKRIRTIIVPFWIWSVVIYLFLSLIEVLSGICGIDYRVAGSFDLFSWKGLVRVVGFDFRDTMPTMWYLRTLFILVCVSVIIVKIRFWMLGLMFVLLIAWSAYPFEPSSIYRQLGQNLLSLRGLFYFSAGLYCRRKASREPEYFKKYALGLAVCVVLFRLILKQSDANHVIVAIVDVVHIPIVTYALYVFCKKLHFGRFEKMAFPIYLLHMIIAIALRGCFSIMGIGGAENMTFPKSIVIFLSTVFLSIVTCVLLCRAFPKFARVAFGGRC